uniref:GPAA1 protein n=1 Tax=Mesocestoides corti TaxID=53468 RepID=A0A5K3F493_MESCO
MTCEESMQPTRGRHALEALYKGRCSQRGGLGLAVPAVWLWLVVGYEVLAHLEEVLLQLGFGHSTVEASH